MTGGMTPDIHCPTRNHRITLPEHRLHLLLLYKRFMQFAFYFLYILVLMSLYFLYFLETLVNNILVLNYTLNFS